MYNDDKETAASFKYILLTPLFWIIILDPLTFSFNTQILFHWQRMSYQNAFPNENQIDVSLLAHVRGHDAGLYI